MTSRRWLACFGVALAWGAGGCAGAEDAVRPPLIPVTVMPVTVMPVSFDANLLTATQCEYKGVASSPEEAQENGANLLLAITYDNATTVHVGVSETTHRNAKRKEAEVGVWNASAMRGKAVRCPKETIDRIVQLGGQGP
jgi:hypothetical protein